GAVARGEERLAAEEALTAGDVEGNDDAVTLAQGGDGGADFFDYAHGLVAEHVALFHRGHETIHEMEVGPADRRGGDADDGVAGFLDGGISDGIDADVALAVPADSFHVTLQRSGCIWPAAVGIAGARERGHARR